MILAAGASRRLGRPKQLVMLDGKPLLQHVIDAVQDVRFGELIVVLGHAADEVAAAMRFSGGTAIVVNPDFASGQSSSLRVGLEELAPDAERAVILLGDQPRIEPDVIRAVADGPGPIRRAVYRGVPGHPVAFDRAVWPELMGIDGDRGARAVLDAAGDRVQRVDIDADVPTDVDTDADLVRLG